MSILLSAYYPEGIVFASDKNVTIEYLTKAGVVKQYVEPTATKVLAWPQKKAIVGFVGRGSLVDLAMDEWMRIFIANTRYYDDIDETAKEMQKQMQEDFNLTYSTSTDITKAHYIIHLGGFAIRKGVKTPVMYHLYNHGDLDQSTGAYPQADRQLRLSEDLEQNFRDWPNPEDYPINVRARFRNMADEGRFLWYNNGYKYQAFNVFKGHVWAALLALIEMKVLPKGLTLERRVAYCKMAVALYGSFFEQHVPPEYRAVGGGVDTVSIPWPI